MVAGELEGVELVVVEGAEPGDAILDKARGQTIDAGEEIEALLEPVGIELEDMPVRIGKAEGAAMALVAIDPADGAAHGLDHLDPPLQRLGR